MFNKIKNILAITMMILTVMGVVTFSLFILEEAFQTVMFGTWAAQDAQDWPTVKAGLDLMCRIQTTLKWVNYLTGWIQPLAFIAYGSYAKSAQYYIQALQAKTLAHAPELFIGEKITLSFTPRTQEIRADGSILATNGKIQVVLPAGLPEGAYRLSGRLEANANNNKNLINFILSESKIK